MDRVIDVAVAAVAVTPPTRGCVPVFGRAFPVGGGTAFVAVVRVCECLECVDVVLSPDVVVPEPPTPNAPAEPTTNPPVVRMTRPVTATAFRARDWARRAEARSDGGVNRDMGAPRTGVTGGERGATLSRARETVKKSVDICHRTATVIALSARIPAATRSAKRCARRCVPARPASPRVTARPPARPGAARSVRRAAALAVPHGARA